MTTARNTGYNSTYPKGGFSCSKDSFVVNGSSVFQIKFCGKSPALRVAANRYKAKKKVICYGRTTRHQQSNARQTTKPTLKKIKKAHRTEKF